WAVGCKLNSVDLQLLVYRLIEDRTPCGIDSYAAASTFWFRALGRLLARHASEHDYVADVFSAQEMLLKLGSDYLQYFPDIKQSWLDVDDVNEEQLHHVNALNQIKKLCALSCVVRTREHLTSTQEALFYTASLAISYLFEDDEDSGLSYFLIDTLVESFHEIRTS
ncbi:MAG: hypothetical protein OXQ96_02370, partial [Alphaproteobacteria bacterium]|nr:hypothetical protein [Alphaproteobacteria bacterium]